MRSGANSYAGVAKLLAGLFQANTISRMIANVVVAKPLEDDDFNQIVSITKDEVIQRLTRGEPGTLKVELTPEFITFLEENSVYAPAGARVTKNRVNQLIEQLVSVAVRVDLGNRETLSLPREVLIGMHAGAAQLHVQAFKRVGREKVLAAQGTTPVAYNPATRSFNFPDDIEQIESLPAAMASKAEALAAVERARPPSSDKIAQARRNLRDDGAMPAALREKIFDQEPLISEFSGHFHAYLNAIDPHVMYMTTAGTVGVGKSATFIAGAEYHGVPIVKINMQEFASQDSESASRLAEQLAGELAEARKKKGGKVLLLVEELDKCFEIDHEGKPIPRPALALIKDLLDKGERTVSVKRGLGGADQIKIDIRGVFVGLSLNFPVRQFGLKADPRKTSIEDMQNVQAIIAHSPESIHKTFSGIFLDDTVNRLLSGPVIIANAITARGYGSILKSKVNEALAYVNADPRRSGHHTSLTLDLKDTDAYFQQYLYADAVIPSEGGRQAGANALKMLQRDLLAAVQHIPTGSPAFRRPLTIRFEFLPKSAEHGPMVIAKARLREEKDQARFKDVGEIELYREKRTLRFPPPRVFGRVPPRRALSALHEFGHAYGAVLLGHRFREVIVVEPQPMVKMAKPAFETGKTMVADIYTSLAARAMERIILDAAPTAPEAFLSVTSGARTDISDATEKLYNLIHQLGMDPNGCTIERGGLGGCKQDRFDERRYYFEALPVSDQVALGRVLRDIENDLVRLFLSAHTPEWYNEKISELARAGVMNEREFYALLEQPYAEANVPLGQVSRLTEYFPDLIRAEPASVGAARAHKQGDLEKTAQELLDEATRAFQKSLEEHLHSCANTMNGTSLVVLPRWPF